MLVSPVLGFEEVGFMALMCMDGIPMSGTIDGDLWLHGADKEEELGRK